MSVVKRFPFLVVLLALWSCASPPPPVQDVDAAWWAEEILTLEERQQEAAAKLARVHDLLKREKLSGLLISTAANVAWITAGGDSRTAITGDRGAVLLFLREDGRRFIITSKGEAPRLMNEDLKGMGYEWQEIAWYGDETEPGQSVEALKELSGGSPFGSDSPFPGARLVDRDVAAMRVPLIQSEIHKYRWLGKRCAEAVDGVCRRIRPGMTERGIEALISDALMRHAILPTSLLIAADERAMNYRQAPTSDKGKVERYVMVSVCARRWGLAIAMTRLVHFGPVSEELQKRMTAAARVYAGFLARTHPGASAGSILQGAIADYAEAGFPDAWREHPQGGAIGYQGRDWLAVPGSIRTVQENEAFAWNPIVQGAKVEDTVLLVQDALEVLTETPGWPMIESRALGRVYRSPGILVR